MLGLAGRGSTRFLCSCAGCPGTLCQMPPQIIPPPVGRPELKAFQVLQYLPHCRYACSGSGRQTCSLVAACCCQQQQQLRSLMCHLAKQKHATLHTIIGVAAGPGRGQLLSFGSVAAKQRRDCAPSFASHFVSGVLLQGSKGQRRPSDGGLFLHVQHVQVNDH